ncbi:MAG: Gfo/Idh/MocA family oxidoreductase [Dehalococcoidia bacterium]
MQPHVGIIGAGFIGRFHARGIHGLTKLGLVDARYVAVCDRVPERAQEFARIAGLDTWTTDPDELIASPGVNTIYVCTPTAEHKELVLKAAAAGKHVFCEKPLARTLDDARLMYEAVCDAGVGHQVGLILRHAPIFAVLKELIDDPKLGRLMTLLFRDDQAFPIGGHYMSDWRKDVAVTGGGTLIEHSIHDLDIITFLAGDVESLRAETRNFAGHEGVEDLASVSLRFASGATGQLVSVWHNLPDRPAGRLIELFFENGYFAINDDFFGPICYHTSTSGGPQVVSDEEVRRRYLERVGLSEEMYDQALGRYSLEDYFFLKALSEGRPPYPGFDVGLRAHELVDAVYRSAAQGGAEVELPTAD